MKSPQEYSAGLNIVSVKEHIPMDEFVYLVRLYEGRVGTVLDESATKEEQWDAYNKCVDQFNGLVE